MKGNWLLKLLFRVKFNFLKYYTPTKYCVITKYQLSYSLMFVLSEIQLPLTGSFVQYYASKKRPIVLSFGIDY